MKYILILFLIIFSPFENLSAQKRIAIDNQTETDLTHIYPQTIEDGVWWTESGHFDIENVADLLQEDELLRQGEGIRVRIEREGCEFTLLARGKNTKAYMVEIDPCKPDATIKIEESNCIARCTYSLSQDVTELGEPLTKIEFANQIEEGVTLTALYIVPNLDALKFLNNQAHSSTAINYLKTPLAYDSVTVVRPTLTHCTTSFVANGSNGKIYIRKDMDLCSDLSGVYFGGLEEVNQEQPEGYNDNSGNKWFGAKIFKVINNHSEDVTKLFVLPKDGTRAEEHIDILQMWKLFRAGDTELLNLLFPTEDAILQVWFYNGTQKNIPINFNAKTIEIK